MSFYLGIDVSKATLDVACTVGDEELYLAPYKNRASGWKALGKRALATAEAQGESALHLIVEPTGGYERGLVAYAHEQGWQVTVVNPLYVRRFIQGQGERGKDDHRDARMLARYGRQQQPAAQWQIAADARELQALVGRRDDLKKLLRAERNRLQQVGHDPHTPVAVRRSIERTIATLEEEQQAVDDAIKELLKRSQLLGPMARVLRTAPGVGKVNVLRLLVLFHRFRALTAGQGTANQLVAFLGLDPQPYQSGRSVCRRPSISRMGDKAGRAELYLGAMGALRGSSPLRTFYDKLVARGKPKKLALVAASRKILVWTWALFNSGLPFDPARATANSHNLAN